MNRKLGAGAIAALVVCLFGIMIIAMILWPGCGGCGSGGFPDGAYEWAIKEIVWRLAAAERWRVQYPQYSHDLALMITQYQEALARLRSRQVNETPFLVYAVYGYDYRPRSHGGLSQVSLEFRWLESDLDFAGIIATIHHDGSDAIDVIHYAIPEPYLLSMVRKNSGNVDSPSKWTALAMVDTTSKTLEADEADWGAMMQWHPDGSKWEPLRLPLGKPGTQVAVQLYDAAGHVSNSVLLIPKEPDKPRNPTLGELENRDS